MSPGCDGSPATIVNRLPAVLKERLATSPRKPGVRLTGVPPAGEAS